MPRHRRPCTSVSTLIEPTRVYDAADLCTMFRCSRATLAAAKREGKLIAFQPAFEDLYLGSRVLEYIAACEVTAEEVAKRTGGPGRVENLVQNRKAG
jgi:hypothetical protein